MRIFIVLLVFAFIQPAFAQSPPEPRPFAKGTTTLQPQKKEEPKEEAADAKKKPKGHEPNVEMWLPPDFQASEGPWPLIVFSHGFGGCARQSSFLTKFLAENGYIVIAPDHADARCESRAGRMNLRSGTRDWPERPFKSPEKWDDTTEADRRDDVLFAVSSMFDDRKYAPFIDKDKIGLMGHSLGGYTVLGLAGAWPKWKDKRFKAVLAMSPFTSPYALHRGLSSMDVPVMFQGGSKDDPITPLMKRRNGAYNISSSPKYFVEFDGADHFSWTELDKHYQGVIEQSALAFFNKYLKGEDVEIDLTKTDRVKTFWKDEEGKK